MNDAVGAISNSQLWTVAFSGIAGLLAALGPIVIARYQTRQAAESAKKEIEVAAIKAREEAKQQARKDAVAEWQTLYGERQREVVELKSTVGSLQIQNTDQQRQLNELTFKHEDCEDKRKVLEAKHNALCGKVSDIEGTVTVISNGKH
jgi:chromosome segregation ATPase